MKIKIFTAVALVFAMMLSLFSCIRINENAPPSLDYVYNTAESHKAIGEYIQAALGVAGLTVNLSNQEWNTFLNTRKNGDYTIARNGWVADYSDPISFLDMWTSDSGNNDVGLGKGEHAKISIYSLDLREYGYDIFVEGGTWRETYDRLIGIIKDCRDNSTRYKLMHLAEDMLMRTGCIVPIYFNTDIYMVDKELDGFFSTPLGYKFFTYSTYGNKDSISVCLASEPDSIDPALNSTLDGATLISHLFSGLAKWAQDKDGRLVIVPDCAEELSEGVENADGSLTYTYKIRSDAKWSDGVPVSAYDFEYSWKRAASSALAADYGYMLDCIKGYGEGELQVKAIDERTLEVTLSGNTSYWNELLAFPVYFPVREDVVKNESWATNASTYVSNGAYKMKSWAHDSLIILEANEGYHDKDQVKMKTVKFFLSDDTNNMLTNFVSGAWQMIDAIPTNELPRLKAQYPDEIHVSGLIGTYYICFNVNKSLLPKDSMLSADEAELAMQEIRWAISLLLDRNYIAEYIGQAGQVPASSFVAMGVKDYDGEEFFINAGKGDGYYGYFDTSREAFAENTATAIEILKKYYTLSIS